MTGATPATAWLEGCLALDQNGFVLTGPDLSGRVTNDARWPLQRLPYLLETSRPGIFAVGDEPATSSAWPPLSAKDRSRFHSFTTG
jgi:thioredoxin reductase (NADPH)